MLSARVFAGKASWFAVHLQLCSIAGSMGNAVENRKRCSGDAKGPIDGGGGIEEGSSSVGCNGLGDPSSVLMLCRFL